MGRAREASKKKRKTDEIAERGSSGDDMYTHTRKIQEKEGGTYGKFNGMDHMPLGPFRNVI